MKAPIRNCLRSVALGSALLVLSLGLGLPVLVADAQAAPKATYKVEKRFVGAITGPGGGVVGGPGTGKYRYLTHAFAEDKHGQQHNDNPQTGAVFGPLTVALAPGGAVANAKPKDADHKWTGWFGFNQAAAGLQRFGPFQSNAMSVHPESEARVELDYLRLPVPLDHRATGRILLDGSAEIKKLPLHGPETAFAQAKSAGEFEIMGVIEAADVVFNGGVKIAVPVAAGQTSVKAVGGSRAVASTGALNHGAAATWSDPMNLSIFDDLTGALLAQQDLFDEEWVAEGQASVEFDPTTGLRLSAGADGKASLSFSTLSGWVLNAFNGMASIENGVFNATGDLALLPWTLSMAAGELVASLSASDFDMDFDFQVLATGLGTTNDVRLVLSGDARGLAEAYATVPAPSTLLLVGLAGIALRRARRP